MLSALVQLNPGTVLEVFEYVPNPLVLPNGNHVGAVDIGYNDSVYALLSVTPGTVASGYQQSGPTTYSYANGVVTQAIPTQAIPASQVAIQNYATAVSSSVTLTWSVSTSLNGTYALDVNTQVQLIGAYLASANFSHAPIAWYMQNGTAVSFTTTQANLFGAAIWGYLTAIRAAQAAQAAGGTPTWPSSSISITG
jgi:hypothetical protein